MDLANRVRSRREELGLSQEELALKMGYSSRTSINKIENGRPISQKIIFRLASALNVSVSYLMGWEEPQEKAHFDVSILKDEELRTMLKMYKALPDDKRKTIIQMVEDYYNAFANGREED